MRRSESGHNLGALWSLGRTPWDAAGGERRLVVLILKVILQVVVVWRRKAGRHTRVTMQ